MCGDRWLETGSPWEMSREIKFRAWQKSKQRMIGWEELCRTPERVVDALQFVMYESVMQYTGLKDKNGTGVEIYEGDIISVEFLVEDNYCRETVGEDRFSVVYCEKSAAFIRSDNGDFVADYPDGEVIGNIHQHPELLEPGAPYKQCPHCSSQIPEKHFEDHNCGD